MAFSVNVACRKHLALREHCHILNFIDRYVQFNAKHDAPKDYHLWLGAYLVGASLSRKAWLGNLDQNPIFPNLYVCLVGPQGLLFKSTCIDAANRILTKSEVIHAAMPDAARRECLAMELKDLQFPPSAEIQTWSEVIKGAEAAFMISELSDLLGSSMRKDDEVLNWIQSWYDSRPPWRPWRYRTVKRYNNPETLYQLCVHLAAATTPKYIRGRFPEGCTEEGLGSRFIWVIKTAADIQRVRYGWGWDTREEQEIIRALRSIHDDKSRHGQYTLADESKPMFKDWLDLWRAELIANSESPIGGFLARKQTHLLKLAMIRAAAQLDREEPLLILPQDLAWASDRIAELTPGLAKLFNALNLDQATRVALQMRECLRNSFVDLEPQKITVNERQVDLGGPVRGMVLKAFRAKYTVEVGDYLAQKGLNTLQSAGWAMTFPVKVSVRGLRGRREILIYSEEGEEGQTDEHRGQPAGRND